MSTSRLKTSKGASSRRLDSITLKPLSVLASKSQYAGEEERPSWAEGGVTCSANPTFICEGLEGVFALFNGNLFLITAT